MIIGVCCGCGSLFDFEVIKENFGLITDYYGDFSFCSSCGGCVYIENVSKVNTEFLKELNEDNKLNESHINNIIDIYLRNGLKLNVTRFNHKILEEIQNKIDNKLI